MEVDVVSITLHELYLSFHFLLLSNIFFMHLYIHKNKKILIQMINSYNS